ncbi:MAG: peptide deformylase [Pseudohongiella sp.]|nr:peptide deformylase [Pseudohongiella sp.]
MSILQILEFPDPRLRKIAEPVSVFDATLEVLIEDMLETMYVAEGIGLAATQINVHKRLLVIDVSENKDSPQAFINPSFEIIEDELLEYDEGCLSVPGFYETVSRPSVVRVTAQDKAGENFTLCAEGILSTCIQHEIDHLNGKLFVDYLSPLKRQRIRSKLEKEHKDKASA